MIIKQMLCIREFARNQSKANPPQWVRAPIVSFERPVNEDIGQHATAEAAQFVPAQHAIPRQPRPVGSSRCTAIGQCVECLGSSSIIFGAWKRDKNIYTDLKHPEGPTRWNCRKKYQEIEIFSRIWQVNPTWQYYTIFMSPADAIPRSGWIKIHKLGYCKPYRFNMNPQRSKLWPCQKVAFSSFSFAVSGNHVFTSGMSGFVRGSGDDSHSMNAQRPSTNHPGREHRNMYWKVCTEA